MSWRVAGWSTGFVVGTALAAIVPESVFPGARLLAFGLVLTALGLLGNQMEGWRGLLQPPDTPRSRDPRPADGDAEVVALPGVGRAPNPHDPRFGRLTVPAADAAPPAATARGCPPLLGRVAVVSIYLGPDGSSWDDRELAASQSAVLRAGRWLEREARRWGAALSIELADTYLVAHASLLPPDAAQAVGFDRVGDEVVAYEEDEETRVFAAMNQAAVQCGFADAVSMFQSIEAGLAADATVWLVHPLECGVSRAYTADRPGALVPGIGLAVCQVREAPFSEPLRGPAFTDPVTIVHETLHLFGATDKYGHPLGSFPPGTVTGQEVMRLSVTRLDRLQVDPLTAREIGWTE